MDDLSDDNQSMAVPYPSDSDSSDHGSVDAGAGGAAPGAVPPVIAPVAKAAAKAKAKAKARGKAKAKANASASSRHVGRLPMPRLQPPGLIEASAFPGAVSSMNRRYYNRMYGQSASVAEHRLFNEDMEETRQLFLEAFRGNCRLDHHMNQWFMFLGPKMQLCKTTIVIAII